MPWAASGRGQSSSAETRDRTSGHRHRHAVRNLASIRMRRPDCRLNGTQGHQNQGAGKAARLAVAKEAAPDGRGRSPSGAGEPPRGRSRGFGLLPGLRRPGRRLPRGASSRSRVGTLMLEKMQFACRTNSRAPPGHHCHGEPSKPKPRDRRALVRHIEGDGAPAAGGQVNADQLPFTSLLQGSACQRAGSQCCRGGARIGSMPPGDRCIAVFRQFATAKQKIQHSLKNSR